MNRLKLRNLILYGTVYATLGFAASPPKPADWPMFGQNLANTANNPTETDISVQNVAKLAVKWTVTTGGDVSARPAVANKVVYFPDWGGNLWAVDANNGKVLWSHQLTDYIQLPGVAKIHSRTTPAVDGNTLYLGTQEGAYLLAVHAGTGQLFWATHLGGADPMAIISTAPVVSRGVVYTGVASTAEGGTYYGADVTALPAKGSVAAVIAGTGAVAWQTFMVPEGYSGAGVWGSNLVVDEDRGTVFASTGNNYRAPFDTAPSSNPAKTYGECIADGGTEASCTSPNNYVDAVVALNLYTGGVKWAHKFVNWNQPFVTDGSDSFNADCILPLIGLPAGPQCPANPGPDYDFGSAPNLITYQTASGPKTILGAGQKSGIYVAVDPDTGAELWHTQVAPGSFIGGMEWGSASDGQRIYVQNANIYGIPTAAGSAGSWSALDPATGAILWQAGDPNGAIDIGPMTVANGVVYASSMAADPNAPTMLALDAATGQTLWRFASGVSVNAGATVVNGVVYWGSGYTHLGFPGMTGSLTTGKFYAFTKNGN